MFLEGHTDHELDFTIETKPDAFLFSHDGLSLAHLARTIDVSAFGRSFYVLSIWDAELPTDMRTIGVGGFARAYGVVPDLVADRYLHLDRDRLEQFFLATEGNSIIECDIIGVMSPPSVVELEHMAEACARGVIHGGHVRLGDGACIWTHDNHLTSIQTPSPDLLRRLVGEAIRGFFAQFTAESPSLPPEELVDLIITEYSGAPLVALGKPRRQRGRLRSWFFPDVYGGYGGAVSVTPEAITARVEAAPKSWTARKRSVPRSLAGRRLHVAWHSRPERWSFEPLPPRQR